MTGWVDFAYTPHTVCALSFCFGCCWCEFCFCLIHAQQVSSVCVFKCACVCVLGSFFCVPLYVCLCASVCIFVFTCRDPAPAPSPTSYRTLPSLCPVSFWLRCSRRHSQTHSGVLTHWGHHTQWPADPQAGVKRLGLVARQPRRKWVSLLASIARKRRQKLKWWCNKSWAQLEFKPYYCLAQPEEIHNLEVRIHLMPFILEASANNWIVMQPIKEKKTLIGCMIVITISFPQRVLTWSLA